MTESWVVENIGASVMGMAVMVERTNGRNNARLGNEPYIVSGARNEK